MTRERLAEILGVTPRFLADAELGFVGVSLTNLKKICEVLGVSADRLLWGEPGGAVDLAERLSHLPPEYLPAVEALIQKQLELLALAARGPQKKTRS